MASRQLSKFKNRLPDRLKSVKLISEYLDYIRNPRNSLPRHLNFIEALKLVSRQAETRKTVSKEPERTQKMAPRSARID